MKRKVWSLVFVFVLFLSAAASAAEDKKYAPPSPFNGELWRGLAGVSEDYSRMFKVCLLRGVYEGAYSVDPQNAYQQYGPWVSFGELADALDRFYSDDKNLRISVTYAIVLLLRNSAGALSSPVLPVRVVSGEAHTLVSMEKK